MTEGDMEEYMLKIHEAVAVICHMHPDCISDQGKNLRQDRYYHGLLSSLHDALSFAMMDLPEREQANTSFDTLYTLVRKLEARQPQCSQQAVLGPQIHTGINTGDIPCQLEGGHS